MLDSVGTCSRRRAASDPEPLKAIGSSSALAATAPPVPEAMQQATSASSRPQTNRPAETRKYTLSTSVSRSKLVVRRHCRHDGAALKQGEQQFPADRQARMASEDCRERLQQARVGDGDRLERMHAVGPRRRRRKSHEQHAHCKAQHARLGYHRTSAGVNVHPYRKVASNERRREGPTTPTCDGPQENPDSLGSRSGPTTAIEAADPVRRSRLRARRDAQCDG